ncbi:hypothetical protein Dda_5804 [Drechslerella dactyloides]|uniref:Nuclease S1 n=1 Tax=Drechslerella dactyloides TaxID=74499 RepID=A0AAD6NHW7_DREDA|nr:hypothetical protein Dda_5804 [Drechslerella dactyloides]
MRLLPFAAGLLGVQEVAGWGFMGHKTVALLASRHLLPETATFVRRFLYRDQSIMDAAVWADRYAHVPFGRYSKGWHYIDARDEPPVWCGIRYKRDCGDDAGDGGCIVSALVNMTARLQDESLPWPQRAQALRFVLHFLGDIHQPLHTEHLARGGNGVHVLFHARETNLHSLWDGAMLERIWGRGADRNVALLTTALDGRLSDGGMYALDRPRWRACLDVTSVQECAVIWASDANKYVCSYVLASPVEGKELGGPYADGAVPIIERMVAAAGYRLAGWLNTIVTGRDGLDEVPSTYTAYSGEGGDALYGVVEGRDAEDVVIDKAIEEYERVYGVEYGCHDHDHGSWEGIKVQH